MDCDTKLMTTVVSLLLILTLAPQCTIGAAEVVQEDTVRSWRPFIGRAEVPTHPQQKPPNSVPRLSVLEGGDDDVHEGSSRIPLDAPPALELEDPKGPLQGNTVYLTIPDNCTSWDFSDVSLLTLVLTCPPLVSGISDTCCSQLVSIAREFTSCFCTIVESVLGASFTSIFEFPTLVSTCSELSNPCP